MTDYKGEVKAAKAKKEAELVARALEETQWNRAAAARQLGISARSLYMKIKAFDIRPMAAVCRKP